MPEPVNITWCTRCGHQLKAKADLKCFCPSCKCGPTKAQASWEKRQKK
ncbi:hypothetical protein SK854_30155 [Lentzea sp. BCCO 10_0061]|uniref:Uncharacterized protein n=1 Tax=Lentzea sokolovensis TaxID=3095429 RepID=A0ABU4V3N2_9PSEU|nr:hypothetical protein [Lentzea sp. BCCO 10_0061]MDX8146411.1 hypothetical protein [Lentzea sp. BCCO 10_0061]